MINLFIYFIYHLLDEVSNTFVSSFKVIFLSRSGFVRFSVKREQESGKEGLVDGWMDGWPGGAVYHNTSSSIAAFAGYPFSASHIHLPPDACYVDVGG